MDALTQLIESYVSSGANAFTDALALSGVRTAKEGLFAAWSGSGEVAYRGRSALAYAALVSGITLLGRFDTDERTVVRLPPLSVSATRE